MEDGEPACRSKRAGKQGPGCFPVIEQLAADGDVNSAGHIIEIVDAHNGSIFAVAVGENTCFCWITAQRRDRLSLALEETNP